MPCFVEVMRGFQARFPTVRTRLYVESLGATAAMLLEGKADIGVVLDFAGGSEDLVVRPIMEIEMVPVCAPDHPLARVNSPLDAEAVREHVQLVLTDRSPLTEGRDHGVLAVTTWRLADLSAKHAMLIAGLGWGGMPRHMVQADLDAGRLVELHIPCWDGRPRPPVLTALAAWRADAAPGPAAQWMVDKLASHRAAPIQVMAGATAI
jgi:DNA-binding transcriptional LysR family regulator